PHKKQSAVSAKTILLYFIGYQSFVFQYIHGGVRGVGSRGVPDIQSEEPHVSFSLDKSNEPPVHVSSVYHSASRFSVKSVRQPYGILYRLYIFTVKAMFVEIKLLQG